MDENQKPANPFFAQFLEAADLDRIDGGTALPDLGMRTMATGFGSFENDCDCGNDSIVELPPTLPPETELLG